MAITLETPKEKEMELPKETLEAFGGDELRARVFYEKYALRDESGKIIETKPEQMWERLSRELSSVERSPELQKEWKEKFYWLLSDFKFVAGGRVMFGAGQSRKSTLLNCYFFKIKDDSIESIFDWCKEAARTYSFGGGVGTDISNLRPRNAPVNNSAVYSSGSVSFMQLFSTTTGTIGQAGRRGALMITIDISHPDVLDFINIKRDISKVNHANISVKITDAFMKAVENDEDFELHFKNEKVEVRRTVRARDVWNSLVKSAWASAEPGLLFWSAMQRESTSEYNGMNVEGVNPCLSKDTLMFTSNGLVKICNLGVTKLWDGKAFVESKIWKTGFKDTITLTTQSGYEIKCTPDHAIFTEDGWHSAKDTLGKSLPFEIIEQEYEGVLPEEYQNINYELLGFILGDGGWHSSSDRMKYVYFTPELDDEILRKAEAYFQSESYYDGNRLTLNIPYEAREAYLFRGTIAERLIPDWMLCLPKEQIGKFLRGLFSANGSVIGQTRIQLVSKNKELLKQVQSMLGLLGIKAKLWYHNKEQAIKWHNGTYTSRKSWHLVISRDSLGNFDRHIGFIQTYKQDKLRVALSKGLTPESKYERVVEINHSGFDEVYDFGMAQTHSSIVGGITVHNCSEQVLDNYNCCDLGSINLSYFVNNQFSDKAKLDYEGLGKAVVIATRFLDNILDYNANKHPLPQQKESSLRSRRIGLGTTGLGDMFIKLGIKYDSDEALSLVETLFRFIRDTTYKASCGLALEKGAFSLFDAEKHSAQPFIQRLPQEIKDEIRSVGLRNVCLLTTPPVGSGSILVGSSSGVEPVFALSYKRRSHSLSQGEFEVKHPLVTEYEQRFPKKPLPSHFIVAHQIKPEFRVKMQGVIQQYIDSAISSTINLPEDIPVETVGQIYFQAWKEGLKGVTVYREGSREGILETDAVVKKPHEAVIVSESSKEFVRPQLLNGKTIKMPSPQGSLYIAGNADESGRIVEVFVELGKRNGDDKATAEAIGRLISAYLQRGGDIKTIVKILKGIRGKNVTWDNGIQILSLPDAVGKALDIIANGKKERKAQYTEVPPEPEQSQLETCPECGEDSVKRENGCVSCTNCSYSKCG